MIVCEGEKTEPNYFNGLKRSLRLTNVEVQVVGKGDAPKRVVADAVRRKNDREHDVTRGREEFAFDQVWCVIDVEQPGFNPSLPGAISVASKTGIDVALSNPCFEFWYLLHFEACASAFPNAKAVVRALKGHLPHYDKANTDVFASVDPSRIEAITRAKDVEKQHERAGTNRIARNPNTEVYKLVAYLQEIAERRPY